MRSDAERMKVCSKCGYSLPADLVHFARHPKSPDGLRYDCKVCQGLVRLVYRRLNRDFILEGLREDYYNNHSARLASRSRWEQTLEGKKSRKAKDAKRRSRKQKFLSVPEIASQIKAIYDNCPEGMVVDHDVPLNHKLVCGLHIPANLQYLTNDANLRKGNNFTVASN